MKLVITVLWLLITKCAIAQTRDTVTATTFDYARDFRTILEKTKDRSSELYYHHLLPKFLGEDSVISRPEILALMIGFTEDPHFKPWEDMQVEKEIFDMNDTADYEASLEASKLYLDKHPLSLRVLKERSFSYYQLKNKDSADYFMKLVDRIMGAMIYSGKGKKPDNPIFSLGLADGEYFIPNIGMTVAGKSTDWNRHNHFMEIIDAMDNMGEHTKYHFVIQHAKDKIDDDTVNEGPKKKSRKGKKSSKTTKGKKSMTEEATSDPANSKP